MKIVNRDDGDSLLTEEKYAITNLVVNNLDYICMTLSEPVSLSAGTQYGYALWYDADDEDVGTALGFKRSLNSGGTHSGGSFHGLGNTAGLTDETFGSPYPWSANSNGRDASFGLIEYTAPAGFAGWIAGYGLVGTNAGYYANPDGDAGVNLYEYGLGGNPTNPSDVGSVPLLQTAGNGTSNWIEYIHVVRTNALGELNYNVELTDNLLSNVWRNAGFIISGTNDLGTGFAEITNTVPATNTQQFIRLNIEVAD